MNISIIVATSDNNVIGNNNQMIWHLPADLKRFKQITTGHTVIMGRKTYESIGKPLPNRRNIVVTRQDIDIPGCEVVTSIDDALILCHNDEHEVFIIGGAEIYNQTLHLANKIYLTVIHEEVFGDAHFPTIDYNVWIATNREDNQPDEKNFTPYSFITLEKLAS